jgi:hypothetical protein
MQHPFTATGDQLANALHALGVNFILGGQNNDETLHKHPARLVAALAESNEARLRLSLIPLFLEHPEFAAHVKAAAKSISPSARLTLQCYYTAAIWLGQKYLPREKSLPDLFSKELNLFPTANPDENLRTLAKRHQELSGVQINWLGTYQHAAQVWQRGLGFQQA